MLKMMTVLDEAIKYIFGYIILLYFFIFAISISYFALETEENNFINSEPGSSERCSMWYVSM